MNPPQGITRSIGGGNPVRPGDGWMYWGRGQRRRRQRGGVATRPAPSDPVVESIAIQPTARCGRGSNDERREAASSVPSNTDRSAELAAFARRTISITDMSKADAARERATRISTALRDASSRSLPSTARQRRPERGRWTPSIAAKRTSVRRRHRSTESLEPLSGASRRPPRTFRGRSNTGQR